MKTLLVGNDGRTHALAEVLAASPKTGDLLLCRETAGAEHLGFTIPIKPNETQAILTYAKREEVDRIVVGPEDPYYKRIVNDGQRLGLRIYGPTQEAAQLEESKKWADEVMRKAGVPRPEGKSFFLDYGATVAYIKKLGRPCFIKPSGPTKGHGVRGCFNYEQAHEEIEKLRKNYGEAAAGLVIEEWWDGDEYSPMAICHGTTYRMLPFTRDYKRSKDNDEGDDMTGGMGAVLLPPDPEFAKKVQTEVFDRILGAMSEMGIPFNGTLYPGIMRKGDDFAVLEANVRFGDPEAQVLMTQLDSDPNDFIDASIDGGLEKVEIKWRSGYTACVNMVSGGYPKKHKEGFLITGIEKAEKEIPNTKVYHCGTKRNGDQLITAGGRVLSVTSWAETLSQAVKNAYAAVACIDFEGKYYRTDIGRKLIEAK